MTKISNSDQKLLSLLRANARMPLTELARRMGLARSTVQARLERLENSGVIDGYSVRLGEAYLAGQIRATLLARLASGATSQVMGELRKYPEIEKASTTSGRFDLVIEMSVSDLARLDEIIEALEAVDGFEDSESLVHLSTRIDRRL